MMFQGLFIGAAAFFIAGLFRSVVVKCEYYWTDRIWPLFLAGALLCCALSAGISDEVASAVLAILGFTLLRGIGELKEQAERVRKGWFPENPSRKQHRIPIQGVYRCRTARRQYRREEG